MNALPDLFEKFTALDCNRAQFITDYLAERGVDTAIIPLEQSRHVYVRFPPQAYSPLFKVKTVLAHYDRAKNSCGANDNSAAVFQLMDWAVRLNNFHSVHNVRIFFTDGEELESSTSVTSQGSFGIASRFRELGIMDDDVYVFDCCGRGDVVVLAKANETNNGPTAFKQNLMSLQHRAKDLLRSASCGSWMTLPVAYSDNASFLARGIPAVEITTLPAQEATQYSRNLHKEKKLEQAVLTNGCAEDPHFRDLLPETWRLLHSQRDTDDSLTPGTFKLMAKLLDALAEKRTMR